MSLPPRIDIHHLIDAYDVLLFDAYGVLVRSDGAIEGAPELIEHLHTIDKPYFVLTNDASRLIDTSAERYRAVGLPIPSERVITSGSLLNRYFDTHDLRGARTMVIGEGDAVAYARQAGAEILPMTQDAPVEVVVIGELSSKTLLADMEATLTAMLRHIDRGAPPRMVLPNPDLIYPKSHNTYGLTAGSITRMFEVILEERYPGKPLTFDRLGKPYAFIYEEGLVRAGLEDKSRAVMVGDQLATDVRGAIDVGIDAALTSTGLTVLENLPEEAWPCVPTYLLDGITP